MSLPEIDPDNLRGTVWVHAKGGRYVVLREGLREHDLEPVVVYESIAEKGERRVWTRPKAEFLDGRFTKERDAGDLSLYGYSIEQACWVRLCGVRNGMERDKIMLNMQDRRQPCPEKVFISPKQFAAFKVAKADEVQ